MIDLDDIDNYDLRIWEGSKLPAPPHLFEPVQVRSKQRFIGSNNLPNVLYQRWLDDRSNFKTQQQQAKARLGAVRLKLRRKIDQARQFKRRGARLHADIGDVIAALFAGWITTRIGPCFYCGEYRRLTIEHVLPLVRGGLNAFSNLEAVCVRCNSTKGAKTVDEFKDTGAILARNRSVKEAFIKVFLFLCWYHRSMAFEDWFDSQST